MKNRRISFAAYATVFGLLSGSGLTAQSTTTPRPQTPPPITSQTPATNPNMKEPGTVPETTPLTKSELQARRKPQKHHKSPASAKSGAQTDSQRPTEKTTQDPEARTNASPK